MKSRKMTPGVFAFAATNYLNRYFASSSMLRQALRRRAYRFIKKYGGSMDDALPLIESEIKKRQESGTLNDSFFAHTMVAEMQKHGASRLKIKQKLFQKGIDSTLIEEALKANEDSYDPRESARKYAKKRGFGPYRNPLKGDDRFQKELASMVRAGHSYTISKEILSLSRDEIEDQ